MPSAAATPLAADDTVLARRIGQGDREAFATLMRRHNRVLYRVARGILKDDDEAEDAVQEAYFAAFLKIASYRGDARLSTWLTRIVINEAYGRLRRRKRDACIVPLASATLDATRPERPEIDTLMNDSNKVERPDELAMRAELRRLLERKIDALPEQYRTVFMLRELEELSVEETAICLDIPAATVRTRSFRARALLRESLTRELDRATLDAFGFAGERCDRIVARVLERIVSSTASNPLFRP